MISGLRLCPKCNAEIPTDAPEGGCPGCLLESGLRLLNEAAVTGSDLSAVASAKADDPDYVSKPARAATKGERAAEMVGELGDYELLQEIGRGGQGVVFRARQKSLNRIVALKVISLGQWASQVHLKRFRREAEAAASLEYPGIVPIHEVGERDGSCYFSMKFIEGGQLDEVVRRTPISIRQAAELIAKVARTVHHAHEHGILHRDIKPGNILLDAKGEPHLTDFGLARLLDTDSTITRTVEVMGTPSYMAPEQASGKNAELTNATDLYGLGAVLYQLLTGHPPFAGGTPYETIKLLLDTEPRAPRQLNPKIDRDLSTICLKCLEKDPQRRYSSAFALAGDLEHWLRHEPITAKPSGFVTHARKWMRRNPGTTVQAALLLALAIGLSVTLWNRKPPVLIPKSVAVLPFENLSDDSNSAYFADGIQEEILTRLAKIEDLKVISRTSTQSYQSKPGKLAEIAKQLGVANIVEGSVQKLADQVRVNVQLINARTDSHFWAESYDRKLTDMFAVESEIAKRIAESLQAKLTGHEEQALAVKPTNNPEAYDAYLRGLSFEARSFPQSSWEAIGSYQRAVQLDPNFATAWARLCRAEGLLYTARNEAHRSLSATADEAKRALETAQKLAPDSSETLLALGYYQYWVLRDYGAAKGTFSRVNKLLPGSSEAPYAIGRVTRREGHWAESIPYFEQALALDPRNVELLNAAALTYIALKQYPAALKMLDRVLDIKPNDPDMTAYKARIYQAEGNLQEAARFLSGINETSSNTAFETKTAQLQFERNYGELLRLQQARLTQDGSDFLDQLNLATYQRLAGDTVGAKVAAERARTTLEPLHRDKPDNPAYASTLALAYALIGEKDLALELAERAVVLRASWKDISGFTFEDNLALVQTIAGENKAAISTLAKLLQEGPYQSNMYFPTGITPALLRLDPLWDPLRADPAFQKLCEEKIDKSIAVLPFDNLSGDPNNAYFADGIQEEILTRLAKIADLKVISRASTQRYQSKPRDLGEIAKQLGVANVVEGGVQKAADRVRVNVQLINAQTDLHLWADSYDRKLTDIFGVQSDIAKGIAESLRAKLTGREEQALAVEPTNNPEAYDAYLRGLACTFKPVTNTAGNALATQKYLKEAVRLDPKFALAWALLSTVDARGYRSVDLQPTVALREEARQAAEIALALQPNLGEALLAKGYYHYYCLQEYDTAVRYFEQTRLLLPNNSQVPESLAYVARRRGQWEQSEQYFNEAERLDPRNVTVLMQHAGSYMALRRFPEAIRRLDQILNITPDDVGTLSIKAAIAQAQGDLTRASMLLSPLHPNADDTDTLETQIYQGILERRPAPMIARLQELLAKPDPALGFLNGELRFWLGWAQEVAGEHIAAQQSWREARSDLESFLKEQPENPQLLSYLALTNMGLGDKATAFALVDEAAAAVPIEKNALDGTVPIEVLARIAAQMGEPDRSIATLQKLLSIPSFLLLGQNIPFTPALLRLDPMFDPLRNDPRFQKLCEENEP